MSVYMIICGRMYIVLKNRPILLATISSAFLSHQISISHQPTANQQYFSLTTNQHQLPATANQLPTFTLFIGTYIATFL